MIPDEVMPNGGRKRLQAAQKADEVRAVWRHGARGCNRVVAVVLDHSGVVTVETYLGRRVMLGREREGGTLGIGPDGAEHVVTAFTPHPVAVRCCGPVWFLDWAEVWKVAEQARSTGRVARLDTRPLG